MAKIKGMWRFKDVLTEPSGLIAQEVNFTFKAPCTYADGSEGYLKCLAPVIAVNPNESSGGMTVFAVTYSYAQNPMMVEEYEKGEMANERAVYPFYAYILMDGSTSWSISKSTLYGNATPTGDPTPWKTITFMGEQEVSNEFYDWFTANAEDISPDAMVTYNGDIIANVYAGQTATLKCAGLNMASDVVVEVAEGTGGGDAEFNIAYGDTPPEDTSKLWVKTSEPSGLIVSNNLNYMDEDSYTITELSGQKLNGYTRGCVFGKYIYSFGGGSYSNAIKKYDTETDVVTTLACKLPRGANNMNGVAYEKYIYVCQGQYGDTYYDYIYKFDTVNETIITLDAKLSVARWLTPMVLHNGKIYIFGNNTNDYGVDCLDPQTDTCISIGSIVTTNPLCAWSIGDYIYLTFEGGAIGRFDPVSLTFETLNNIGNKYCYLILHIGNELLCLWSNNTLHYNLETNTLYEDTKCHSAIPSNHEVGYQIGNKLYTATLGANFYVTIYQQIISLANGKLQLVSHNSDNIFRIVNTPKYNVEIGVKEAYKGNENNRGDQVEIALYKNGAWTTI